MLDPFWQGLAARGDVAITGELTILFRSPTLRLAPIARDVLERAARLRADYSGLKTPDAIHAATALAEGAAIMLTNDPAFRQIAGLMVRTPRDLAAP